MTAVLVPPFRGQFEPEHPCREMVTRHCPAVHEGVCGGRPCARFESEDPTPWWPEIDPERIEHAHLAASPDPD
jgi:hypothetical protein